MQFILPCILLFDLFTRDFNPKITVDQHTPVVSVVWTDELHNLSLSYSGVCWMSLQTFVLLHKQNAQLRLFGCNILQVASWKSIRQSMPLLAIPLNKGLSKKSIIWQSLVLMQPARPDWLKWKRTMPNVQSVNCPIHGKDLMMDGAQWLLEVL